MNDFVCFKKSNYLDIRIIHDLPFFGVTLSRNDPLFISCKTKILHFPNICYILNYQFLASDFRLRYGFSRSRSQHLQNNNGTQTVITVDAPLILCL